MRTEKQRQSSRINGTHSHGPSTPEGKAISSKNGIKYGICLSDVSFYDDPEANNQIGRLRTDYFSHFQPRTPFERDCLEEIALCQVRLARLRRIGEGLLTDNRERAFVTQSVPGPDGNPIRRFERSLYPPEEQSIVLETHLAVAWRQDHDVFDSLSRQETRLSNRLRRAEKRFDELLAARQNAAPEEENTEQQSEPDPAPTPAVASPNVTQPLPPVAPPLMAAPVPTPMPTPAPPNPAGPAPTKEAV